MQINKALIDKLDEHLEYLNKKDEEIRPLIDMLHKVLLARSEELMQLPVETLVDMLLKIMSTHTDCIMLTTKIREVLNYEGVSNL